MHEKEIENLKDKINDKDFKDTRNKKLKKSINFKRKI